MRTHKICTQCGQDLPRAAYDRKDARGGIKSKCKQCLAPQKKTWAKNRTLSDDQRSRKLNRDRSRTRHGLTPDEKRQMIEDQGGTCAVCGAEPATSVDHDHSHCPGRFGCKDCVRGILCSFCNSALGYAQDSPLRLQQMIDYLNVNRIGL